MKRGGDVVDCWVVGSGLLGYTRPSTNFMIVSKLQYRYDVYIRVLYISQVPVNNYRFENKTLNICEMRTTTEYRHVIINFFCCENQPNH